MGQKNKNKNKFTSKLILGGKILTLISLGIVDANATNWLMLQGTEPGMIAPDGVKILNKDRTPRIWGFIQANYADNGGDIFIAPNGKNITPFSLLTPDLQDQSGFNIARARLAARGMADSDNLINYFFMTDFANNGINNLANHSEVATYFTDASITLKHIPGAKIRVGKFKTPGSEEGLQAVFVSPYIEFTTMLNQQLLERQISDVGVAQTGAAAGGASTVHYTSTSIDKPIAANRDLGIEVFDTFKVKDNWTLSYAYMYGNGTGISYSSSNAQATHYGYLAAENIFGGGKGYYTQAMKFYVWGLNGKRILNSFDGTSTTEIDTDRERYGVGATYYNNGLRLEAEYVKAKGMIYTGAKDIDTDPGSEEWQFQFAFGNENEADGGYVNVQYEIIPKKLEVFGRYDFSNRLTNDIKAERQFTTTTLGASYRFRGPTRIDFNYLIRDAKAPGNTKAQKVLDNFGDKFAIQFTAAF